jgi:hypothetical protein
MSKNTTPEPSDAEDYLNQLHYKSKYGRRHGPWYLIPKLKYKPVLQIKDTAFSGGVLWGFLIFFAGALVFSLILDFSGFSIFMFVVVLLIGVILFFAMRDAQKTFNDHDDKDPDY